MNSVSDWSNQGHRKCQRLLQRTVLLLPLRFIRRQRLPSEFRPDREGRPVLAAAATLVLACRAGEFDAASAQSLLGGGVQKVRLA